MGKRGPLSKNKSLKVMSGNLPMSKANMIDAARALTSPPDAPDHLNAEEKKIWSRTIELLVPLRHLEVIDGAVLAAYCSSYVRWCEAEVELKKQMRAARGTPGKGLLTIGANGQWVVNPLVNVSRRAQADMVGYAAQLGMTPAARLRVQVEKPAREDNPFESIKRSDAKGHGGAKQ